MDQDPAPYQAMKLRGASAEDVYRKAQADGFKKHECLALIMGVFGLELSVAREIGHQLYWHDQVIPQAVARR